MLWLLACCFKCFIRLKVHCPVAKCPIWALVLNSQSQRTDELSTIERGSSCMKSPSFCDWNCLSPSILLSWPNIWQAQSFQRQVLLVCDNLWHYPSGGLPKHHWPWACVEKQPFGLIDVPSETVAMEERNCLQIFFTRSLEGWREAEVHNIWQNVTPLQLPGHVCTAKAKLCTLCKFRARVTRLSKTLCTCTHSQGLCTVHSAGVYYLDIAFNMQEILVTNIC